MNAGRKGTKLSFLFLAVVWVLIADTRPVFARLWNRELLPPAVDSRSLVYRLYQRLDKARHEVGAGRNAALGEVLKQIRSALDRHQDSPLLWYLFGLTLHSLGRPEAVNAFLESRRRGARGTLAGSIAFYLAVSYVKKHRCDLALQEYERSMTAVTSDFGRALIASNAAECEMFSGKLSLAVRGYRRALQFDPGSKSARWGLAVALDRLGRFDEAVVMARAALAADPHLVSIVGPGVFFVPAIESEYYLAMAALAAGDATAAAVHWKKYLDGFPDSLWRLQAQRHLAGLGHKPVGWRVVVSAGKAGSGRDWALRPVRRAVQSAVGQCLAVGRPDPAAEMHLVFAFVLDGRGAKRLVSVWPQGPWVSCLARALDDGKTVGGHALGRQAVLNVRLLVDWGGVRVLSPGEEKPPQHSRDASGSRHPGRFRPNRN